MNVVSLDAHTPSPGLFIKDGTSASFMSDVIQASMQMPVLVDFWATWCGPCKQLMPALEKIVRSYNGKVKLVKIDIDKNKQLAQQLQIQSVPMVYAFSGGHPVDAFMGVLPDSEIRAFIDRILGGEKTEDGTETLAIAKQELQSGNVAGAAMLFQQILVEQPASVPALAGLGLCYVKSGDLDRAQSALDKIAQKDRNDQDVMALIAALDLAKDKPEQPLDQLQNAVDADPKNQQLRLDLANGLIGAGILDRALDVLLDSVALDKKWNDEAARKQVIKILDMLGFDDPRAISARKRLSSILFP